jgi:hypothetical protein
MEMITDRNDTNRNAAADRNLAAQAFTTGQGAPFIARPNEILNDPVLGTEEKRSILAAWLSDKYAVPDAPRLASTRKRRLRRYAGHLEGALCARRCGYGVAARPKSSRLAANPKPPAEDKVDQHHPCPQAGWRW